LSKLGEDSVHSTAADSRVSCPNSISKYPPVMVWGMFGVAGNLKIGFCTMHTQGSSGARDRTEAELANVLELAEATSQREDLDLMVVVGDANLQNIPKIPSDGDVNVRLHNHLIQCPTVHERALVASGVERPANLRSGLEWWPQAATNGPWVILRPSSPTLSSDKLADSAFVLRRRPVDMLGPWASAFPFLKRSGTVAANQTFGSDLLHSDHKPIEISLRFSPR